MHIENEVLVLLLPAVAVDVADLLDLPYCLLHDHYEMTFDDLLDSSCWHWCWDSWGLWEKSRFG